MHGKKCPNCIISKMISEQVIANQVRDLKIIMALQEHQFNSP